MQAIDQTSVGQEYGRPRMTSGERYCLVVMSSVKCLWTQQPLPRSAILEMYRLESLFLPNLELDAFTFSGGFSSDSGCCSTRSCADAEGALLPSPGSPSPAEGDFSVSVLVVFSVLVFSASVSVSVLIVVRLLLVLFLELAILLISISASLLSCCLSFFRAVLLILPSRSAASNPFFIFRFCIAINALRSSMRSFALGGSFKASRKFSGLRSV
mmetsp:Transcript_31019/g.54440  ORF Transcript_31019/g.54440 Transcript_31019/m.54440 type:complete len:213 (+) Transcript_31019:544-1182(+)